MRSLLHAPEQAKHGDTENTEQYALIAIEMNEKKGGKKE